MLTREEMNAEVADAMSGRRPGGTGWSRADCPFCEERHGSPDRKQCLSLNTRTGGWHCFRCGVKGYLGESEGYDHPEQQERAAPKATPELPPGCFPLWEEPASSSIACAPLLSYLRDVRRVPMRVVREARIHGCVRGAFAGRVVIPAHDAVGRLAGWVSRTTAKRGDYRNMSGMDREALLYNASAVAVETIEPLLVVEGVFDALPFWPHAVAVFGKPGQGQVRMLARAKRPIVVVLDGDAWREGARLAMQLQMEGARASWLELPPRTDPDEVPREDLLTLAREAAA